MGLSPFEQIQSDLSNRYSISLPIPLLKEALTHPSYKIVDPDAKTLERLEIYGDAALDLVVTAILYEENLDLDSGEITKTRSRLVNNNTLSHLGYELQLDLALRCGNYEPNERDMANAVEAVFGAICHHSGYHSCREFYLKIQPFLLNAASIHPHLRKHQGYNPIGALQEFTQKRALPLPEYQVISQEGPDHEPVFEITVKVTIEGKKYRETAQGRSKKRAKAAAAAKLLLQFANDNPLSGH